MCGIAGWLNYNGIVDEATLRAMNKGIAHRGPDADDVMAQGGIGLCHRRLSIIDLSATNDQPLTDNSGRYTIVFNGEIYNYIELRRELEASGVTFRTQGDTEVLLEAYKKWGKDSLNRLLGMFAFAIWDRKENNLFLARDPIGKKPLFYSTLNGAGFAFASEPSALLPHPQVDTARDDASVRKFLVLGYTTGPDTIWKGIKRFPPAHCATITPGKPVQFECYKDLIPSYQDKSRFASTAEAVGAFNHILDDATKIRCRADVPYGLFLSGGLDSNSVLSSMVRAIGSEKTRSFSIGFSESDYDESALAEQSAKFFGAAHQNFTLDPAKIDFEKILSHMGAEPLADVSYIPMHVLSHETRKHVKMVLTGDGGDELFAGYPTYIANRMRRGVWWVMPQSMWQHIYKLADDMLPSPQKRMHITFKLRQFLRGVSMDEGRAHFSWRLTMAEQGWADLMAPDMAKDFSWEEVYADFAPHFEKAKDLSPLDRALYVDTKTWLTDGVMVKADRATMANGLEARAPLLDIRMVDFAARLPNNLKLDLFGTKKKIMRMAGRERLPSFLMEQKKRGFSVPVAAWLKTGLADQARAAISSPALDGVIDRKKLDIMFADHMAGKRDYALPLFNSIILARNLTQKTGLE